MAMTGADLGFSLIYIMTRPLLMCFPSWLCGLYYTVIGSCQMSSNALLLYLNIDKFISICWPLRYHSYVTGSRVKAATGATLTIMTAVAAFSYFGKYFQFEDNRAPNCLKTKFDPANYYAFITIIFYAMPIVISFVISVYVFVVAQLTATRGPLVERRDYSHVQMTRSANSQTVPNTITSYLYTCVVCASYLSKSPMLNCICSHCTSH